MWPWQHKNELNRQLFWIKIIVFCALIHLFLLGYFFFFYKEHASCKLTLNAAHRNMNIPVIFLPLQKTVAMPATMRAGKVSASRPDTQTSTTKQSAKNTKKVEPAKKIEPVKSATVEKKSPTALVEKSPEKKIAPSQKKSEQKKIVAKPEIAKKVSEKKELPKPEIKEEKKPEIKEDKKIEKKELEKKEPIKEDKKSEKKELIEPAVEQLKNEVPVVNQEVAAVNEVVATTDLVDGQPEALYVGRDDLQARALYGEVCDEVMDQWKVPVGISKELDCQIRMIIDHQGKAQNICVVQSSGVLMYDVSARTAVARVVWPKAARGKEFTITFKQ